MSGVSNKASGHKPTKSEYCEVRHSRIHKRGMFTVCSIPRDTRIIEYVGEKITKAESERRGPRLLERSRKNGGGAVYIFDVNKRHDLDGNVPYNTARFINHSCHPNCEAQNIKGRIWIVSLRKIKIGVELAYDYGYTVEHYEDHPCQCGARKCLGYIVRNEDRRKLKRLLNKKKNFRS